MKVLVVVSSKYGSTWAVGEAIAAELTAAGIDAAAVAPADVETLAGADAVVLGSPIYMNKWMEPARAFIARFEDELRRLPLWAFSVGMAGVPGGAVENPPEIGMALLAVNPIDHRKFSGRLDMAQLDLRERSIARLGRASQGDFRDWDRIRAWARQIAEELREHVVA